MTSQGQWHSLGNEFGDFSYNLEYSCSPAPRDQQGRAPGIPCTSPIRTSDLDQGLANCGPWTKFGLLPVFVWPVSHTKCFLHILIVGKKSKEDYFMICDHYIKFKFLYP